MGCNIDSLGYIIEFSIGLAGFSGVIAVFTSRLPGRAELDRWRIRNLLLLSMGPAFISFAALALLDLASSEGEAWRLACLIQATFLVITLVVTFSKKTQLAQELQSQIRMPVMYLVLISFSSLALLLATAGLGISGLNPSIVFYMGLVFILLVGAYQFFRAVLQRLEGS